MKNVVQKLAIIGMAGFLLIGCTTTNQVYGPSAYVGFRSNDRASSVTQSTLLGPRDKQLSTTYEDEYTYDKDGRVLKHKQIVYTSKEKTGPDAMFHVYETLFKPVGSYVLPATVSVNGVVYMEVEYELLAVAAKGEVTVDIAARSYRRNVYNSYYNQSVPEEYELNLQNNPVDWNADDKFIKATSFIANGNLRTHNSLTMGFDNVVLKKYHFSTAKLLEGRLKSINSSSKNAISFNPLERYPSLNRMFTYEYEWEVQGGKICQKLFRFNETVDKSLFEFIARVDYSGAGLRTKETWSVREGYIKNDPKEREIFTQELTY
jgi:hypothetical protein